MSTITVNRCYRCRTDCVPVANLSGESPADGEQPVSFVCVGFNRKEDRVVQADRFTLCWKNEVVDERGHWDRRDMLDTMSVIAQALSIDENIRVNNNFTELDMQEVSMNGDEPPPEDEEDKLP